MNDLFSLYSLTLILTNIINTLIFSNTFLLSLSLIKEKLKSHSFRNIQSPTLTFYLNLLVKEYNKVFLQQQRDASSPLSNKKPLETLEQTYYTLV